MSDDDTDADDEMLRRRINRPVALRDILGRPGLFYDAKTKRVYGNTRICQSCRKIVQVGSSTRAPFNATTGICNECTAKGVALLGAALDAVGVALPPERTALAFDRLAALVAFFRRDARPAP